MSTVAERLRRDIEAVIEEVVVTDHDVREARAAVEEHAEARSRRDRRLAVAGVATAAAAITVVAVVAAGVLSPDREPEPTGPAPTDPGALSGLLPGQQPTTDLLTGVWRKDDDVLLVRFLPGGEVRLDSEGTLFADGRPSAGRYEIDGDTVTVRMAEDSTDCAGESFAMGAVVPRPGTMQLIFTSEATGSCLAEPGEEWRLEQILPTSTLYDGYEFSGTGESWPAPTASQLHGVWYLEGGGHLVQLTADGQYVVVDGTAEAADRGRWTWQQAGASLTLTSSDASASCDAGDRLVLREAGLTEIGGPNLQSTIEGNTCRAPWAVDRWVRLSP
ncbi:hypothetical protein [Nocardioides coralli]|uniref:hypothetical protein n=1 Tax=Nocardioides coralli TaxID=2872154 RepID=UPI001CA40B70|nr:hypothetical protein [Nocardioides coralli]QZY30353.1 hypothetical protein K6T13_06760 [Nocardioides coralli]